MRGCQTCRQWPVAAKERSLVTFFPSLRRGIAPFPTRAAHEVATDMPAASPATLPIRVFPCGGLGWRGRETVSRWNYRSGFVVR